MALSLSLSQKTVKRPLKCSGNQFILGNETSFEPPDFQISSNIVFCCYYETNIAPTGRPSQKENSFSNPSVSGAILVSKRKGTLTVVMVANSR